MVVIAIMIVAIAIIILVIIINHHSFINSFILSTIIIRPQRNTLQQVQTVDLSTLWVID